MCTFEERHYLVAFRFFSAPDPCTIYFGRNHHVEPLAKSTFYFSIAVLVIVDIIQSRYQKKLAAERAQQARADNVTSTAQP